MKINHGVAVLLTSVGLALLASPGLAHHSFASVYDVKKPVKLVGTVTKIEWKNPHASFLIDVKDKAGKVTQWDVEMGSPNILMRRGWTRSSMKEGDAVTVEGYQAKDGSNVTSATVVILNATGKRLFEDNGPPGYSKP